MKSKKRDSNTHKKSNFTEDIKSKNSHNNIAPNKQMPKISKVQKPKGAKANRNDAESLKSDNQSEFLQDSDNGNSDNEIIKSQIELSKSEVPKNYIMKHSKGLSYTKYIDTLNNQCCTLRNPKSSIPTNIKKNNQNNKRKNIEDEDSGSEHELSERYIIYKACVTGSEKTVLSTEKSIFL
ncbi:chloride channel protein E-like isoform X1 [Leptopilina boulardi]|uniref:chloride channel protein E-like isoform X1 n=1 Tax=Leptopilina boulardi TaxID=63433 RepID=UPI0021F56092|nr:chloride channel protein E-like isoform X1 [Leptopilina boulardi]XP_051171134.1 chloride channel protein E-like isoform X1 [Leptopilina boulardi]